MPIKLPPLVFPTLMQPKPFLIDVSPEFINFTVDRVATSRFPVDVQQPDWTDGPPNSVASAVRDYWVSNYSWTDVQTKINKRYNSHSILVIDRVLTSR
jgi:hypothetical protein